MSGRLDYSKAKRAMKALRGQLRDDALAFTPIGRWRVTDGRDYPVDTQQLCTCDCYLCEEEASDGSA